jgi:hypothetical protein
MPLPAPVMTAKRSAMVFLPSVPVAAAALRTGQDGASVRAAYEVVILAKAGPSRAAPRLRPLGSRFRRNDEQSAGMMSRVRNDEEWTNRMNDA